jgi:hypothetical protein
MRGRLYSLCDRVFTAEKDLIAWNQDSHVDDNEPEKKYDLND